MPKEIAKVKEERSKGEENKRTQKMKNVSKHENVKARGLPFSHHKKMS